MTSNLTARQRDWLAALVAHILAHGRPPTLRELMRVMGCTSPFSVKGALDVLERKGWVTLEVATARGITVRGLELRAEIAATPAGDRLRAALSPEVEEVAP